jgi:hypothetical protein
MTFIENIINLIQVGHEMSKAKVEKKETRSERFKRSATARTNAVLKRLKVLGNCANRQRYEYSEEDVEKIFTAIEQTMVGVRRMFYFPKKDQFKL